MIVQIQIRSVYGDDKAYPMNNEACCIARIAGTKTLTRTTLLNVLAMGCTIEELDRHGVPSRSYAGYQTSNLPAIS